jgi:hypothetical protein
MTDDRPTKAKDLSDREEARRIPSDMLDDRRGEGAYLSKAKDLSDREEARRIPSDMLDDRRGEGILPDVTRHTDEPLKV